MYDFFNGASLTRQKYGDEQNIKIFACKGVTEAKNVNVVFFADKTGQR